MSDLLGSGLFVGFGAWFLLAPQSVIAFYSWFHRGRVVMPKPLGVRTVGALSLCLLVAVAVATRWR
jgi:hypothetical protein